MTSIEHKTKAIQTVNSLSLARWNVWQDYHIPDTSYWADIYAEKDGETLICEIDSIQNIYKLEELKLKYGRILELQSNGSARLTLLKNNAKVFSPLEKNRRFEIIKKKTERLPKHDASDKELEFYRKIINFLYNRYFLEELSNRKW
jgi:hypothetical protein